MSALSLSLLRGNARKVQKPQDFCRFVRCSTASSFQAPVTCKIKHLALTRPIFYSRRYSLAATPFRRISTRLLTVLLRSGTSRGNYPIRSTFDVHCRLTRAQLRALVKHLHARGYLGRLSFFAGVGADRRCVLALRAA